MESILRSNVRRIACNHRPTGISRGKCSSAPSPYARDQVTYQERQALAGIMPFLPSPAAGSRRSAHPSTWNLIQLAILTLLAFIGPSSAVYIDFDNCLSPNIKNSITESQTLLQFVPYNVWASFNATAPSHTLNITVYGNITGIATNQTRPAWDDPQWQNDNKTLGKIVDEDKANEHWSTFFARFNVLDYTPYEAPPSRFCNNTLHRQCPLIPAFDLPANA